MPKPNTEGGESDVSMSCDEVTSDGSLVLSSGSDDETDGEREEVIRPVIRRGAPTKRNVVAVGAEKRNVAGAKLLAAAKLTNAKDRKISKPITSSPPLTPPSTPSPSPSLPPSQPTSPQIAQEVVPTVVLRH